jgi:hypothetical protein
MTIAISGTTGITLDGQFNSASSMGFKNRIINGGMVISQRNGTSSFTPANGDYTLDRWIYQAYQAGKVTCQQNAAAVTPPTGFGNYLGYTSTSAYTVGAGEAFWTSQRIEGFNTSDLAWGTASAATITLSFWVRSSLTGTFGGFLGNSAANRSYPFSYTILSANTWEQKTVTIAGDTSGTWIGATNGIGVIVGFSLGTGSTFSTTAGAWAAGNYYSATGATSVVGTNGATFYITGVQLEKGSTATSFDYRPYGTELALCQRYFWKTLGGGNESIGIAGYNIIGNAVWQTFGFPVTMRASPAVTVNGTWVVSNTGQPTIRAASETNFILQAVAVATGPLATYPNSSDDFINASIEL